MAKIQIKKSHFIKTNHDDKPDKAKVEPKTGSAKGAETQGLEHHYGRHVKRGFLFSVIPGFMLGLLISAFLFLAHGSLAPIYLGSAHIDDTMSDAKIEKLAKKSYGEYRITVKYADGKQKQYSPAEAGIALDENTSSANAKSVLANSPFQRLKWYEPIRIPLTLKTNKVALQDFIDSHVTVADQPAKDAALSISSGTVIISPESDGKGSSIPNAKSVITSAVANQDYSTLVLRPQTLHPAIHANELVSSKKKAEAILNQKVEFTVAGRVVNASPVDVGNWLDLSPVKSDKTVDVTVNSGKVLKYINQIAAPYISPPRARLITNANGVQIVLDPGANGIDVINKDQSAASVAQQLLKDNGLKVDLNVQYAQAKTIELQPYDKWIVVDTTNKRMYAYEQTNLVRSFLVSAGAPKTPTVLGQYKIYAKYVSQDMSGPNTDGTRYFQPDVPYVNYFYGGYAIHGNYWRPASYFGNINSSHGCVGITVSDAAWLYDWAPIGTPVITHG